jgi:hypothetical protein
MSTISEEYRKTWAALRILSHPDRNLSDQNRARQCRAAVWLCNVVDRSSNPRLRRLAMDKLVEISIELGYDLLLSSDGARVTGLTRVGATPDNPPDYEVKTARQ